MGYAAREEGGESRSNPNARGTRRTTRMETTFAWPGGASGAVSLTFDDGLDSHRAVVAPLLERYDMRGTFYICPRGSDAEWGERSRQWQPVLDAGHEIGNHTIAHPA